MDTLPSNLTEYKLFDIPHLRLMGRNVTNAVICGEPVALFWGASGIEMNVKSREVWALIETDYDYLEIWLCVWINGRIVSRFMPEKGTHWVCLCRGFSGETANKICLMRDSQAMSGDIKQIVRIHKIAAAPNILDGEEAKSAANTLNGETNPSESIFLPLAPRPLKIEFIGDSITSGEGLVGSPSDMEWISTWISPSQSYAVQAAEKLNAEYSVVSQCGWGIVTGYDNNIYSQIPRFYGKVCGLCGGENQRKIGSTNPYDFEWQPDFVFVNLGTNDSGAFSSPAWKDPLTEKEYKMRTNPDGSYNEEDALKVTAGVKSFLRMIRVFNPAAKICWLWGMIDVPLIVPYLQRGVDEYKEEEGDRNVYTLVLPSMSLEKNDEDKGSRGHPGPLTHKNAAEKIVEFVYGKSS